MVSAPQRREGAGVLKAMRIPERRIAVLVALWLAGQRVGTHHIDPRKPWPNGFGESFNARFRDEFPNQESFHTVAEARILARGFKGRSGALPPPPRDLTPWATSGHRRTRAGRVQPPPSGGPGLALGSLPSVTLSSAQAVETLP